MSRGSSGKNLLSLVDFCSASRSIECGPVILKSVTQAFLRKVKRKLTK